MKAVIKEYFHSRDCALIYAHTFLNSLGRSLITIFSSVLLYQLGLSIPHILLFYAVQFGLMGALSPVSPWLASRFGAARTFLIGSVIRSAATALLILASSYSAGIIILLSVLIALDGAVSHPLINAIPASYVANKHKGKVNSLTTVLRIIGAFASVSIGGLLIYLQADVLLSVLAAACLIGSIIPYFFLSNPSFTKSAGFRGQYAYLFSRRFRDNLFPFGIQALPIIELNLLPLFIFLFHSSILGVSSVIGAALILELIITLLFGKRIDSYSRKSFLQSTLLKAASPFLFLLAPTRVWFLSLAQTYNKITENLFKNTFDTFLQRKATNEYNPLMFTTAKEMILCFTELFVLIALAGISYAIGSSVFVVIFVLSSISTVLIYAKWKD